MTIQFWVSGRDVGCRRDLREVNKQMTSKAPSKGLNSGHRDGIEVGPRKNPGHSAIQDPGM